jgi:anthranilate synthase component 1
MIPTLPKAGEALTLQRSLPGKYDPLDLYAALTDGGARTDTMLFETRAQALIVERAALRAECRGLDVTVTALTHGGRQMLETIADELADHVVTTSNDEVVFRFERCADDDDAVRLAAPSPLDVLRALSVRRASLSLEEPFALLAAGMIAFDHVEMFETLPGGQDDPLGFPNYLFWLAESLVVVQPGGEARIVCAAFGSDDPAEARRSHGAAMQRLSDLVERCRRPARIADPAPADVTVEPETDLSDEAYAAVIERAKAHIVAGDVYQIVPSRTFRVPCSDPLAAFARARRIDPSPYMFFVSAEDHVLFGASPETSVRVLRKDSAPIVEIKPIAGTRPRGLHPDIDDKLEVDLRLDDKEMAEHMMLVDLARNDVARVSAPGTRRVARLLSVERYARVMHLVSSVQGRLADGFDALTALQAGLNVGTLSGAPKLRATELLRTLEATRRGAYGGAIGWISGNGEMDTGVVIRSAVVKEGTAFVRAGAGVVFDSDPMKEADESRRKASAVLSAIAAAEAAIPARQEAAE